MNEMKKTLESLNYVIEELESQIKATTDREVRANLRQYHAQLLGTRLFFVLFNVLKEAKI